MCYLIIAFSINPFMDDFTGMYFFEVTDQNNAGVFSSLSRNFEQTVDQINNAGGEKSTTSTSTDSSKSAGEKSTTSTSTSSSKSAREKSTASNVPIAAFETSNLVSSNSTTTDDLGKKNQTDSTK